MTRALAFYRPAAGVFASAEFKHLPPSDAPLVNPSKMDDAERVSLLQRVRAGQVLALRAAVRVFGESLNANGLRPRPGSTHELAENTHGLPFITNHRMDGGIDERHGVIVDSKFVEGEVIDLVEFRNAASMEALLLNNLGEFSIQYSFAHAECSKCQTAAVFDVFGRAHHDCECRPGSRFKHSESGRFLHVELYTDSNERLELSTVNAGAFPKTALVGAFETATEDASVCFSVAPRSPAAPSSSSTPQTSDEGAVSVLTRALELNSHSEETMTAKTEALEAEKATPEAEELSGVVEAAESGTEESERASQFAALKARAEAAENAAFKLAFNKGVEGFKFGGAAFEDEQVIWEHRFDRDVEKYAERVSKLPRNAAYATSPIGESAAEPSVSNATPEVDPLALVKRLSRYGFVKQETIQTKGAEIVNGLRYVD